MDKENENSKEFEMNQFDNTNEKQNNPNNENKKDIYQDSEKAPIKNQVFENLENKAQAFFNDLPTGTYTDLSDEQLALMNKEGKWIPYEHLQNESAFFSFFPNCFFKIRNIASRPFTFHPFKCFQVSLGEILLTFIEVAIVVSVCALLALSDIKNGDEATGTFASVLLALSFASSGKNLIFHIFLGMPWERQVKFHKFLAFTGIAVSIVHGVIMGLGHDESLSGLILACAMGAIIVFSFFIFRRYCYSLFYILHWMIIILIIVYAIIHEATFVLFGVGAWGLDIIIRIILISRFCFKIQKTELYVMPGGLVRVEITPKEGKRFYFRGGQYVFICIPKANIWEFHPISISNSSFDRKIVLHFKKVGRWTKKVFATVEKNGKRIEMKENAKLNGSQLQVSTGYKLETTVLVNGPYGAPRVNIDSPRYQFVILIAGGIGVTPMQSIYNELLIQYIRGRPLVKVKLIWSLRDVGMLHTVANHEDNFYNKNDINPSRLTQFSKCHLTNLNFSNVMEPNFYFSRNATEQDLIDLQKVYKAKVHLGRPKYAEIFEEMAQMAMKHNQHDIAVLSCGPSGMIDSAFKTSYERTKRYKLSNGKTFKVNFDFHSEVFEF
jgi:predicted ferric reductase